MKSFNGVKFSKWPKPGQWQQFLKTLNKKERYFFFASLSLFLISSFFLLTDFYLENTEVKPGQGGSFIEEIVGQPRLLNPIYAPANDIDRDLSELIFSGLLNLTKEYQILEQGKVFEFYLKENLFWQDGFPISTDDIVFTIKTIQNPDYKSPLRPSWLGVEVEKISETGIRFTLKNPSAIFLENTALKILPKHIWQDISPNNFPLSIFNLKPIGSGPYKVKKIVQDKTGKIVSLDLIRNPYSRETANIGKITFKFRDSENDLIKSTKSLNLYSFSLPRYFAVFFNPQKQKIFEQSGIIQALNYGTDKQEIIDKILAGKGKIVDSPILPEIYGFNSPQKIYQFNIEKAKELLEKASFKENSDGIREKTVKKEIPFQFKSNLRVGSQGTEVTELQKCLARDPEIFPEGEISGYFGPKTKEAVVRFQEKYLKESSGEVLTLTRKKLNEICFPATEQKVPLSFTLIVPNQTQLVTVAKSLKEQWKVLGVEIKIKAVDISRLEREVIKSRDYEAILFGEILGSTADPFPFWHSSQKKDPGLNLAMYENNKVDKLLEEARQSNEEKTRQEKLEKFQELFLAEIPVVLLYNPDYLYFVSKEIKGINTGVIIDPSKRFSDISNWYIKTKRVWKSVK